MSRSDSRPPSKRPSVEKGDRGTAERGVALPSASSVCMGVCGPCELSDAVSTWSPRPPQLSSFGRVPGDFRLFCCALPLSCACLVLCPYLRLVVIPFFASSLILPLPCPYFYLCLAPYLYPGLVAYLDLCLVLIFTFFLP